jgi:hypothetical protein
MYRDIRDPKAIGAALETRRAHSANEPITKLADQVLTGMYMPNYGESPAAFRERVHTTQQLANGQLAMFRSA